MPEQTTIGSATVEGDRYGDSASISPVFVPADRYRGVDTPSLERALLWPRVWQIVCREEELRNPGSYVTYEIAGESVVVIRGEDRKIRAFYNVCQHRGRRLLDKARGEISNFFCRYHGWKWGLDGALAYVHHREQWDPCGGLDDRKLALKEPQCDTWAGWVWVNLDPDAQSLNTWLGEAVDVLAPFDLHELRRAFHVVLKAPIDWKVVVEAFNEGYHAGATHSTRIDYGAMWAPIQTYGPHNKFSSAFPGLSRVRELGKWRDIQSLPELVYQQSLELYEDLHALVSEAMMRAVTRMYRELPADASPETVGARLWDLHKEEVAATGAKWPARLQPMDLIEAGTSWHLFPNTMVFPSADAVLWYRMRPDPANPAHSIFDIWRLSRYAEGKEPNVETQVFDGFEAAKGVNTFLEQDFDNMVAVHEGMKSRGWSGAVLNPSEEASIYNFHRQLDRFLLGAD